MEEVTLERFAYTPHGVFGRISTPNFQCYSVERPWLNNQPYESCIPEGVYNLTLGRYNRGGYPAYEILNVPNRTQIKIHIGNTMDDVVGCIAVGKSLGFINGMWAVSSSRDAFMEFMKAMYDADLTKISIYQYRP